MPEPHVGAGGWGLGAGGGTNGRRLPVAHCPLPAAAPAPAAARGAPAAGGPAFADVLAAQEASRLRFSAHAQQRLAQRQIDLDAGALDRLQQAVDQASARGGHESLILLDELALIVSIDNRTVITAVDTDQARGNVFTNVDSVVIASRQ